MTKIGNDREYYGRNWKANTRDRYIIVIYSLGISGISGVTVLIKNPILKLRHFGGISHWFCILKLPAIPLWKTLDPPWIRGVLAEALAL